jgi:hypothetical protein
MGFGGDVIQWFENVCRQSGEYEGTMTAWVHALIRAPGLSLLLRV